jgi:hypothetical protein
LRYEGAKKLNFTPSPAAEREDADFQEDNRRPVRYARRLQSGCHGEWKNADADGASRTRPRVQTSVNAFRAQVQAGLELRDELGARGSTEPH